MPEPADLLALQASEILHDGPRPESPPRRPQEVAEARDGVLPEDRLKERRARHLAAGHERLLRVPQRPAAVVALVVAGVSHDGIEHAARVVEREVGPDHHAGDPERQAVPDPAVGSPRGPEDRGDRLDDLIRQARSAASRDGVPGLGEEVAQPRGRVGRAHVPRGEAVLPGVLAALRVDGRRSGDVASVRFEVEAGVARAHEPGRGELGRVPEDDVRSASARLRDRGRGERAALAEEAREAGVAAVPRIDVERHDAARAPAGDPDVRVGAALPPAADDGGIARGVVDAVRGELAVGGLAAGSERENGPAELGVGERRVEEPVGRDVSDASHVMPPCGGALS